MTYAAFLDHKGALRCAEVNPGIECWYPVYPAMPARRSRKGFFVTLTPARPERSGSAKPFLVPPYYTEATHNIREIPDNYLRDPDLFYSKCGRYSMRRALAWFNDRDGPYVKRLLETQEERT